MKKQMLSWDDRRLTMRGRILISAVLFIIAVLNAPQARGGDLFPPDIKRIKDRGKIVVAQYGGIQRGFFAFDDTREDPTRAFFIHEGRRLVGCDIFLANKIARELGVKLELDRSAEDFDSVCTLVASGQADIAISKLSITLYRAQYVRFTNPYSVLQTGILVNRVFASLDGIDGLYP